MSPTLVVAIAVGLTAFSLLVAIGVAGMLIGRAGVITSSLTAVAASLAMLLPLDSWTSEHTARYPVGIDLLPTDP